jgi:hypothetical protein
MTKKNKKNWFQQDQLKFLVTIKPSDDFFFFFFFGNRGCPGQFTRTSTTSSG